LRRRIGLPEFLRRGKVRSMKALIRRTAPAFGKGPQYLAPSSLTRRTIWRMGKGCELEEGVVLVVLEQDVVEGAVGLDQVGLEEERFHLVAGDDELELIRLGGDLGGLAEGVEVAGHPGSQILGLAHVADLAPALEEVDPGGFGQGRKVHEPHRP